MDTPADAREVSVEHPIDVGTVMKRHMQLEHTRKDGVTVSICSLCSDAEREDGSRSYLLWPCDAYQLAAKLANAVHQRDRLVEALGAILFDHEERMNLYPETNNQPNRVDVMNKAKAALRETPKGENDE